LGSLNHWEKASFTEDNKSIQKLIETVFTAHGNAYRTSSSKTLKLHLRGTPFQLQVWQALFDIPYGCTVSYDAIAKRIQKPLAVRAVGTAIGRNPIAILIPCHRVISKTGKIHRYRYGTPRKKDILKTEEEIIENRKSVQNTLDKFY